MATQSPEISNFGANVRFSPQHFFTPSSEAETSFSTCGC
jgi:hypothetical protein